MDLLRFSGMDHHPEDKGKLITVDRPSFHSGSYFFMVVHATSTKIMFEVWSTELPCDPEKFIEDITNSSQMTFKLSVYCRRPVTDVHYTMKHSDSGDPYMLLDCELYAPNVFKLTKGVHYTSMDTILDYITIGEDTEDRLDYPISVERVAPQIQDLSIPITEHRFITTIRIGKVGTELDDRLLDAVYEVFIQNNASIFQSMIGFDQSHYVNFINSTRADLSVDEITIDTVTSIVGVDRLIFAHADLHGITYMLNQKVYPISSEDYDYTPNLLLIAPYFYRTDHVLPYIQSVENIEIAPDQEWGKITFNTKVLQFFDTEEEYKKHHGHDHPALSQYTKMDTFEMEEEQFVISLYGRKLSRVDLYRTKKSKTIPPVGYAQVIMKDKAAMMHKKSANIVQTVGPHILYRMGIEHAVPLQIIYREPTKLHIVF